MFFASLTLCLWIPSGWGQAGEHGLCYLYRGSRSTWRQAHRRFRGAGTPHGAPGVAVGTGGWKSPCSFWKSEVTFQHLRLLGSFLPKPLPALLWSLSCKSGCCTPPPGAEPLPSAVPQQHLQVCRCWATQEGVLLPKASCPVLSLVLVQHVQLVLLFCLF